MNIRALDDREEIYGMEVLGKCSCGESVIKVIHSSISFRRDGTRYYYPGETSAWGIFSCKSCHKPIDDTFQEG